MLAQSRACLVALAVLVVAAPAAAAGFFRVAEADGRFWLVDPDGRRFFSTGANLLNEGTPLDQVDPANPSYSALREYASFDAWYGVASRRFLDWGFNTVGAWSSPELVARLQQPYTLALHLGQWVGAPWVDVMSPDAQATIRGLIERELGPHRDDPRLVGIFVDNELRWYEAPLFCHWAVRAGSERPKQALFELVRREYGGELRRWNRDFEVEPRPRHFSDLAGPLAAVRVRPGRRPAVLEQFVEFLADEYYRTVAAAVRAVDENHLLLGDRFASFYSQPVARACARHMDVVSVNFSWPQRTGQPSPSFFETLHAVTRKPVIVSEFYATAMENRSGNRNRKGPYLVVDTQEQRARAVATMTETLARLPYIVGYHWFEWSDEPAGGRADGEDFNMGLVDLWDRPYDELATALARSNMAAVGFHETGPKPLGLTSMAGVTTVPPAVPPVTVDGRLHEWDLSTQWVPSTAAQDPDRPFGDFWLAWEPRGLVIGLAYYDYSISDVVRSNVQSRKRLRITIASERGGSVETTVCGFDERQEGDAGPLRPLAGERSGVIGEQEAHGLLTMAEVVVPARLLGREVLRKGDRLRLGLRLVMQGQGRYLAWPKDARMLAIALG